MRQILRTITLIVVAALAAMSIGCLPRPRFAPPPGNYDGPQSVTITDKDASATIFYTTDGSTPSTSSPKYTGPIVITGTRTLQAIAVNRAKHSGVAKAKYRVNAPTTSEFVVAGSGNPSNPLFGIIDFTNPNSPNEVDVTTVAGGTIVACNGAYVAVGDGNGGRVWIYSIADNIANPTAPPLGFTDTKLKPIGALTYNGNYILAGGASGGSAVLIDATNPTSPQVFLPGLATGVISIGSVGLSGSHGIDAGLSQSIDIIDYTNPAQPPPPVSFTPTNFGTSLSADLDGTLAAVGDQGSSKIDLVDITVRQAVSTCLPPACQASTGINAISIKAAQKLVAVGSNNDFNMYLIDFSNLSAPAAKPVPPPGGAGGWTVTLDSNATHLAAGNVVGTNVALFSVTGNTATLLKNWPSKINAVNTICISSGPPLPALTIGPNSLAFSSTQGNGIPAPQRVSVGSTGSALSFTVSTSGATWLTATGGGNTPGTIQVSVNTTGLAAGNYAGSVMVTSPGASNSPQTIPVTLTISRPALTVSPSSLAFSSGQGGTPAPQTVSVGSTGATLNFTVNTSGATWLTATGGGNTPGAIQVSANTTGLAPGSYTGAVVVTSPGASNSPQTVPVTLTILAPPILTVTKVMQPTGSPGLFNLQIDGVTKVANVGNGGSTGPQVMSVGSHVVNETAGSATNLNAYTSSVDCGAGPVSGTSATVNLALGDNKTCTITNLVPPQLTIKKVLRPAGDRGLFNLQIDGVTKAANVGNGGSAGPQVMTVGSHTVGETAGTGTNLANYSVAIGGDCAANGSVTLAPGDNKNCTITNVTPPPPTNLMAQFVGSTTGVVLTWFPSRSSSNLSGYKVYRSTVVGSGFTLIGSAPAAAVGFTDATVKGGTTYYYAATALDANGNESVYSTEAFAVVP